jgi:hypothetical protein
MRPLVGGAMDADGPSVVLPDVTATIGTVGMMVDASQHRLIGR